MTIIYFLLWLIIVVLFLLLFLSPLLIAVIVVYLAVRYRIGILNAFERLCSSVFAFYRRIWYNSCIQNQKK